MLKLPPDHAARFQLNDEAHARPPEALERRARINYIALVGAGGIEPVIDICRQHNVMPPEADAKHFSADFGAFRLKWERHTEYSRFWFLEPGKAADVPFARSALANVPPDWLENLPGEVLVASQIELFAKPKSRFDVEALSEKHFGGNTLIGASIAGGLGYAVTDFRIAPDGFSRILVYEDGMAPRQRGRTVQRLLEIDTYRMLALLCLPVARQLAPVLDKFEADLTGITALMRDADESREPELLDQLTLLHGDIVRRHTGSQFRFSAARAYCELVSKRIVELRESRIEGMQTFAEFIDRRFGPAMRTCEATSERLAVISERVARATQLLSTRVDISTEKQNQALLESMNTRASLQLRLQQTVEGLSIAAITYYVVGLVNYALKGAKATGVLKLDPSLLTALSIPVVLVFVAFGIRHIRKALVGK